MLGFERQPVDHYMRTFYVAAERRYAIYRPFCVGSRPRHANMMDWQRQFLDRYADCRKFSFVFHPLPAFQPTRGSLEPRPSPRTASLSVQPLLQLATDRQTHIHTDHATLGRLFSLVFHSVPAFQLARGSLDPRDSVPIGPADYAGFMVAADRQTHRQTDHATSPFVFHSELSHDDATRLPLVDADLRRHLATLRDSGHLDRAVLVLLSDHGPRCRLCLYSYDAEVERVR